MGPDASGSRSARGPHSEGVDPESPMHGQVGLTADGAEKVVEREGSDRRVVLVRREETRVWCDEVAAAAELGVLAHQRLKAAAVVRCGGRHFEGQGPTGHLEQQVDLAVTGSPVRQPEAFVSSQPVQVRRDQVLLEVAHLDAIAQRRQAPLQCGVAHGAVDEAELAPAPLTSRLLA